MTTTTFNSVQTQILQVRFLQDTWRLEVQLNVN